MANPYEGDKFDDFLAQEGLLEEAEATAIKRVVSMKVKEAMEERHLSKSELARQMETSRSAVDRLLDPENTSITLQTISKAARVLGKKFDMSFTERP